MPSNYQQFNYPNGTQYNVQQYQHTQPYQQPYQHGQQYQNAQQYPLAQQYPSSHNAAHPPNGQQAPYPQGNHVGVQQGQVVQLADPTGMTISSAPSSTREHRRSPGSGSDPGIVLGQPPSPNQHSQRTQQPGETNTESTTNMNQNFQQAKETAAKLGGLAAKTANRGFEALQKGINSQFAEKPVGRQTDRI